MKNEWASIVKCQDALVEHLRGEWARGSGATSHALFALTRWSRVPVEYRECALKTAFKGVVLVRLSQPDRTDSEIMEMLAALKPPRLWSAAMAAAWGPLDAMVKRGETRRPGAEATLSARVVDEVCRITKMTRQDIQDEMLGAQLDAMGAGAAFTVAVGRDVPELRSRGMEGGILCCLDLGGRQRTVAVPIVPGSGDPGELGEGQEIHLIPVTELAGEGRRGPLN